MSRARGLFPLFLASTFGIVNGLFVFGPAFKEQQQEKEEQKLKSEEVADILLDAEPKALRDVEATVSRKKATESTLKADNGSNSWWSSMSIWSRGATPPSKEDTIEAPEKSTINERK